MSPSERAAKVPAGERSPDVSPGKSEQKLQLLLGAAAGLMAELGYAQTSIRRVAKETGLSLAGMYYYFENKEDLLFQIQQRTFAALLEAQERALAEGGTPVERLRRLLRNHLAYFTSHGDELKICTFELHSLQGERYATIEKLRRRYYRCLADVIADIAGVAADDQEGARVVRHYALFVFGMLNWIFMWFDPERDAPVERLGDEMLTLVMGGLQGAPPPAD